MRRMLWSIVGFLMLGMGILSLILGFMGLSLSPIAFVDRMTSPMTSIVIKMAMMLIGFIIFYFARLNPQEE